VLCQALEVRQGNGPQRRPPLRFGIIALGPGDEADSQHNKQNAKENYEALT
jgi:hypothetical protein